MVKKMVDLTSYKRLSRVLLIAGSLLSATSLVAQTLAAVDFNAGGTDAGFSNAYNGWLGSNNVAPEATGDLTYANYGIVQTGTGGKYYSETTHTDRQDSSALSNPISGDVWFSILVNVEVGGDFAGISFHSSAPSQPYFHSDADLRVAMSDSQLLIDWGGNVFDTNSNVATGSFSAGTHLILGRMTVVAGNDTLSIWVDPDVNAAGSVTGLGAATYTNSSVDFTDLITHIGMPGDIGTMVSRSKVYMDAIRVSNKASAFEDVTGISVVPKINAAAIANDASGITLLDIASVEGMSVTADKTPTAEMMGFYRTAIASANGSDVDTAAKIVTLIETVNANTWKPSDISTALWLDASDTDSITDIGGLVSQWDDKSGNDYNVTQVTDANKPSTGTTTMNGLNVLDWGTSASEKMLINSTSGQNWQDTYIVGRWDGGSTFPANNGLFTGYGQGTSHSIGIAGSDTGGDIGWYDKVSPNNAWFDNAYVNGTEIHSPWTVLPTIESDFLISNSADSAVDINGLTLGGDRNGVATNRGWKGVIAEVVVFNSKLSASDRQKLEGYLAHKWGLKANLPSDHPYSLNAPLTSAAAVAKINAAAVANDASGITLSDIASVDGLSFTPIAANLSTYQTIIASASGFADAAAIDAAFKQPMLITVNTASGLTVDIPLFGTVSGVTIDWGDGNTSSTINTAGTQSHTYGSAGNYVIEIDGSFTGYGWQNNEPTAVNVAAITGVTQWNLVGGVPTLTSVAGAFRNHVNLTAVPNNIPSSVADLTRMFKGASIFNQDIGSWNTAGVTNMQAVFMDAIEFNQDIGSWNTAGVSDMANTFYNARAFNQDIGSWNTAGVNVMEFMFMDAIAFNQDIGSWDTGLVTDMSEMFRRASAFNQDISRWITASVTDMSEMFMGARLSVNNYDRLITAWDSTPGQTLSDLSFHGGHSVFCATDSGVTDPNVTDGGQNCAPQIVRVTLADDATTITVTWSKPVFANADGTGALTVNDYELAITGSGASLAATPTSISQNGNSYTLGLGLTGTLNSDQVISVLPAP